MRASGLVTAITAALLLSGCTSGDDDPAPAAETCTISLDFQEIKRARLEWVDRRGPNIDRDLRASRSPEGDLCLDIVTDHADPGSTAVSYRIVARHGDREWIQEGEDPSGAPPLLVDATGCVTVTGELEVLGADDRAHLYPARMRVQCDGGRSDGAP